jgi:hypothetical protein
VEKTQQERQGVGDDDDQDDLPTSVILPPNVKRVKSAPKRKAGLSLGLLSDAALQEEDHESPSTSIPMPRLVSAYSVSGLGITTSHITGS